MMGSALFKTGLTAAIIMPRLLCFSNVQGLGALSNALARGWVAECGVSGPKMATVHNCLENFLICTALNVVSYKYI